MKTDRFANVLLGLIVFFSVVAISSSFYLACNRSKVEQACTATCHPFDYEIIDLKKCYCYTANGSLVEKP